MNEDELNRDEQQLLKALRTDSPQTSSAHDDAVLAAARAAFSAGAGAETAADEQAQPTPQTKADVVPMPSRSWWPMALAATFALGIAVLLWPTQQAVPPTDLVVRGSAASEPEMGAVLERPPAYFRWGNQRPPAQRRLVLRGEDARILFASDWQLLQNEVPVDGELLQRLEEGGNFYWSVESKASGADEFGPFQLTVLEP